MNIKLTHTTSKFSFNGSDGKEYCAVFFGTHYKLQSKVFANGVPIGHYGHESGHANKTAARNAIRHAIKSL